MKRLYAIDCDGTLLDRSEVITPDVYAAIQLLKQRGQKIVLATARSYDRVIHYIDQLKLGEDGNFSILFDGAQVVSNDYSQLVHSQFFSTKALEEVFDLSRSTQSNFLFHSSREVFSTNCFKGEPRSNTGYKVVNFSEIQEQQIFKIIVRRDELNIERSISLTESAVSPIGKTTINITPKGVSKGNALEKLLQHMQPEEYEIIAIGDNLNDISMFGRADYRIAMANSKPSLIAIADMVTSSNEVGGVAKAIHELEKGTVES